MHLLEFSAVRALPIAEYQSHGASAHLLADGAGESHVYAVHLEPGGEIGPHPAGFGQLFLVVSGDAWVEGNDGARHVVHSGHGAFIGRGETHAKGSVHGCTAIMIQIAELSVPGTPA